MRNSRSGRKTKLSGTVVVGMLLGMILGAVAQAGELLPQTTELKPAGVDSQQAPQPFSDMPAQQTSGQTAGTISMPLVSENQQGKTTINASELSLLIQNAKDTNSNPSQVTIQGGIATIQQTVGQLPGTPTDAGQNPGQPQTNLQAGGALAAPISVPEMPWGGQLATGSEKSWVSVMNWCESKFQYHPQTRTNQDGTPQVVQVNGLDCQVVDMNSNVDSMAEPGQQMKMSGIVLYVNPDQGIVKISVNTRESNGAPSTKIFEGSQLQMKITEGQDGATKNVQIYDTPDQLGNRMMTTLGEDSFSRDPGISYN